MKFYVQHDENGKITGTVYGQNPPNHPRQIVLDSVTDVSDLCVDLNTRELVLDNDAIAAREYTKKISKTINSLAAQKLDELIKEKPADWADLSTHEKAEIYVNFTDSKLDATMDAPQEEPHE